MFEYQNGKENGRKSIEFNQLRIAWILKSITQNVYGVIVLIASKYSRVRVINNPLSIPSRARAREGGGGVIYEPSYEGRHQAIEKGYLYLCTSWTLVYLRELYKLVKLNRRK